MKTIASASLLLGTLLLSLPGAGRGQVLTVMGPDADKVQPIAASIKERPSDWIITVEDEPTWQRLRLQWRSPSITAFTDTTGKVTYVRRRYALSATPEKLRHTLAHEIGHMLIGADEYRAEKWASDHGY